MQTIVAATRNGAFAASRTQDLGTIEAGKFADLLVLEASPLVDIRNIRGIRVLMSSGKGTATKQPPPATIPVRVAKIASA